MYQTPVVPSWLIVMLISGVSIRYEAAPSKTSDPDIAIVTFELLGPSLKMKYFPEVSPDPAGTVTVPGAEKFRKIYCSVLVTLPAPVNVVTPYAGTADEPGLPAGP
jgi:hypothetical protein